MIAFFLNLNYTIRINLHFFEVFFFLGDNCARGGRYDGLFADLTFSVTHESLLKTNSIIWNGICKLIHLPGLAGWVLPYPKLIHLLEWEKAGNGGIAWTWFLLLFINWRIMAFASGYTKYVSRVAGLRLQRSSGSNLAVWELFRKKMWQQELGNRVLIVPLVTWGLRAWLRCLLCLRIKNIYGSVDRNDQSFAWAFLLKRLCMLLRV